MLRYEWIFGTYNHDEVTSWRTENGSRIDVSDKDNLGLTKFAEQTEKYFRGISGNFTIRILDEKNEPAWRGNTRDGFAFLFKPARGRRFRR